MLQSGQSVASRWLTALSLIATAEATGLADIASQNAVAIATSHAATELLLGLVAGPGFKAGLKGERFPQLVERAMSQANNVSPGSFSAQLHDDLTRVNTSRNAALHEGVQLAGSEVRMAISTTRALLSAAPAWVPGMPDVLAEGLAGGVAALIDIPDIANGLRTAESNLRAGRLRETVEIVEEVLDVVLSRAGLPTQLPRGGMSWDHQGRPSTYKPSIDDALAAVMKDVRRDERWVLRLAIGASQRDLRRLSKITTSMRNSRNPSHEDAAWALSQVAEITYRLSAGGVLDPDRIDMEGESG